jgi:hypothetical protein
VGENTNWYAYIFPAVAFGAAILYYAYGALDRVGLDTQETFAHVTEKNFAQGSTTYHTNIVAGRAWTQSSENPDAYMVGLEVEGTPTGGFVTKQMYETLAPGERVRVKYKRTRFSNKLLVTDVSR